ncbi:MAG: rod-binding protein [Treponema sp.]|jgi:flagellar protein FlgJ|nr:rod-binding protein [Treponema sp.]
METGAVGSQYFPNTGYVPFNTLQAPGDPSANDFALLLEKQAESPAQEPRSEPPPALGVRKIVVDKNDKLYEQCEALETFLIKNLLKSMRSTVQKSGLLDTGFAGEMYEDMLYDEYAKDFTKNAHFGFAETAYLELTGQRGKLIAYHA